MQEGPGTGLVGRWAARARRAPSRTRVIGWSEEAEEGIMDNYCMNVNYLSVGMKAPEFHALTTFGPVNLSDYRGKWLIFFSHPGDFTPGGKD